LRIEFKLKKLKPNLKNLIQISENLSQI
jgi:hypothetical protein